MGLDILFLMSNGQLRSGFWNDAWLPSFISCPLTCMSMRVYWLHMHFSHLPSAYWLLFHLQTIVAFTMYCHSSSKLAICCPRSTCTPYMLFVYICFQLLQQAVQGSYFSLIELICLNLDGVVRVGCLLVWTFLFIILKYDLFISINYDLHYSNDPEAGPN